MIIFHPNNVSPWIQAHKKEWKIFVPFVLTAISIVTLHLLLHPVRILGMDTSVFYMDEKYTLASFFSVTTAFLIGFLSLSRISPRKQTLREKSIETAYGLFFLILSFDEYFEVHEYITTIIKQYFHNGEIMGVLANASWMFPLSIVIVAIFILLIVKIVTSKKDVQTPMIAGCMSFILVLAFELLGSITYGQPIYVAFVAAEEGMEMIGISFFLLATLIEERKQYH